MTQAYISPTNIMRRVFVFSFAWRCRMQVIGAWLGNPSSRTVRILAFISKRPDCLASSRWELDGSQAEHGQERGNRSRALLPARLGIWLAGDLVSKGSLTESGRSRFHRAGHTPRRLPHGIGSWLSLQLVKSKYRFAVLTLSHLHLPNQPLRRNGTAAH